MGEALEEVVANIRSALISTKGMVPLNTLNHDYSLLIGSSIPYRKFGANSLKSFVESIPSLRCVQSPNGQTLVDVVPTSKAAHIISMVGKQKNTKKPTSKGLHGGFRSASLLRQKWTPTAVKGGGSRASSYTSYYANRRSVATGYRQVVKLPACVQPPPRTQPIKITPQGRFAVRNELKKTASFESDKQLNKRTVDQDVERAQQKPPLERTVSEVTQRNHKNVVPTTIRSVSEDFSERLNGPKDTDTLSSSSDSSYTSGLRIPYQVPVLRKGSEVGGPRSLLESNGSTYDQQVESLQANALDNVNYNSPVWRRSWSSSDESPKSPLDVSLESNPGTALERLYDFVKENQLEMPVMKILCPKKVNRGKAIICKMKIGDSYYSSYPEDCATEQVAKEVAARNALEDLQKKHVKDMDRWYYSNERDVLSRVPDMIEKHLYGMLSSQLELDYLDKYKERLPSDWINTVIAMPNITVEPCLTGEFILIHSEFGQERGDSTLLGSDVSVPTNTINLTTSFMLVEVTAAVSTIEVWCRALSSDESEEFANMVKQMDGYYKTVTDAVDQVNKDGFYVARVDDCFYRVRAVEAKQTDVLCFFIDTGCEQYVPTVDILPLNRVFARIQAQAFVCSLQDLELFVDVACSVGHLQNLVGRQFQAEFIEESDKKLNVISVVLFDDEFNINRLLYNDIVINLGTPELNKEGRIQEVYITTVDDKTNDIYVQLCSEGLKKFAEQLTEIEKFVEEQGNPQAAQPDGPDSTLYLVRHPKSDKWLRCVINDTSPDGKFAQLLFIDCGDAEIVTVSKTRFVQVEQLSTFLALYPRQMVKVRAKLNCEVKHLKDRLMSVVQGNQTLLMKIVNATTDGVPVVEFFKRSEGDNILFSVNQSLLLQDVINMPENNNSKEATDVEHLKRKLSVMKWDNKKDEHTQDDDDDVDGNQNGVQLKSEETPGTVPSTGRLKGPVIPELLNQFNVVVPLAVSPYNFFVQPHSTRGELQNLMKRLQERYAPINFSPISIEDVIPGHIYASRYKEDGKFYRTSVIKVIHPGAISVYYCDFGHYATVTLNELILLDEEFLKLPYQAIKARLANVKPLHGKWSVDDCTFFKHTVSSKPFVSFITSREHDELYTSDIVLCLILVDTSTENDVYIDRLLVQKGIAFIEGV